MAESTIVTGQFVRISQTPASVGERILARLIDYVIMFLYALGTVFALEKLSIFKYSDLTVVVFLIMLYLPLMCYSLLFEVFNNGQSIGKKILNIRVVKADGSTPTFGSYLLRWLLYGVDVNLTGGLGLIVVLLTRNSQRLGDLAAGTMVIKEKNYRKIHVSLDEYDHLFENYRPYFAQAENLSLEQINVITRTLESYTKDRSHRIAQLAAKIRQLFSLQYNMADEIFLNQILRDYQYYALQII